jgi:molybdenum cofactor cytidylyltransferase
VARYPAHAQEVDDPGVLMDIDTLDDLQRARALYAQRLETPSPAQARPAAAPATSSAKAV